MAGGKAHTLAEMQRAGFCVPQFVCSPPDLEQAFNALGTPLVVRSSASVEDGGRASFAGLFHSCLNLRSLEEVARAVDRCRASVAEPAVVGYCRKQGIDPRSVHMDVIVQRMVQPELAGVAFTVNPVTGADEIVAAADYTVEKNLVQSLADAVGRVLNSPPGQTWVRLRLLGRDQYAESESLVDGGELPVFVTILKRQSPLGRDLEVEVTELTRTIARVIGRPAARVHIEYAPAAVGRVSFGGSLIQ